MHFCNASHFPKENVQQTKMLESGKMHLMRTFCFAEHFPLENVRQNAFWHQMHFCINKMLQMHLMPKCILAYIFQRKMFSCAKMHLMRTFCYTKCYKCIFATHHIFQRKMFSCAKMLCFLLCKKQRCVHFVLLNIFLWKMFSCAKMHLMQKCI